MLFLILTMIISVLFVVFDCYIDDYRACVVFDCWDDDYRALCFLLLLR